MLLVQHLKALKSILNILFVKLLQNFCCLLVHSHHKKAATIKIQLPLLASQKGFEPPTFRLGEAPRGAFLTPYKSPKILDFTGFSGISLLANSRPKPANFSWFFHLFEMGERFLGVFFQNFLKKFFANKKPPISLVIEVNRRRVEIFIILVYNRKLRER